MVLIVNNSLKNIKKYVEKRIKNILIQIGIMG